MRHWIGKQPGSVVEEHGVKPTKYVGGAPMFSKSQVVEFQWKTLNAGDFFRRQAVNMVSDAKSAIELTEEVTREFEESLGKLAKVEADFKDRSKKVSGSVRDSADKLAAGLSKVEKAANFDRLERYVVLLERASAAMTTLAELQETGKLDKIAAAVR